MFRVKQLTLAPSNNLGPRLVLNLPSQSEEESLAVKKKKKKGFVTQSVSKSFRDAFVTAAAAITAAANAVQASFENPTKLKSRDARFVRESNKGTRKTTRPTGPTGPSAAKEAGKSILEKKGSIIEELLKTTKPVVSEFTVPDDVIKELEKTMEDALAISSTTKYQSSGAAKELEVSKETTPSAQIKEMHSVATESREMLERSDEVKRKTHEESKANPKYIKCGANYYTEKGKIQERLSEDNITPQVSEILKLLNRFKDCKDSRLPKEREKLFTIRKEEIEKTEKDISLFRDRNVTDYVRKALQLYNKFGDEITLTPYGVHTKSFWMDINKVINECSKINLSSDKEQVQQYFSSVKAHINRTYSPFNAWTKVVDYVLNQMASIQQRLNSST